MSIKLDVKQVNDKTEKLSSHFFGLPLIPNEWLDQDLFDEEDMFLCRIDLEDLSEFTIPMQKKGALYFFVNLQNKSAKVLYNITNNLITVDFNDGLNTSYDIKTAYKINFKQNDDYYIDGTKMFVDIKNKDENEQGQEMLLLQYDSLDSEELNFGAEEEIYLKFYINRQDLKERNFAKVRFEIEK